jgi:small subunit ribosomal protein S21
VVRDFPDRLAGPGALHALPDWTILKPLVEFKIPRALKDLGFFYFSAISSEKALRSSGLPPRHDSGRRIVTIRGKERSALSTKVYGNNVEKALKALKRQLQKEGLFREVKNRSFYEKPSEKRKRKRREARKKRVRSLRYKASA